MSASRINKDEAVKNYKYAIWKSNYGGWFVWDPRLGNLHRYQTPDAAFSAFWLLTRKPKKPTRQEIRAFWAE